MTEEERKMAMRAVVSSFITHKEQMSAAMAGNKEVLSTDRSKRSYILKLTNDCAYSNLCSTGLSRLSIRPNSWWRMSL